MSKTKNKILNILAVIIGVIPVYAYIILNKFSGNQNYDLMYILGVYFGLSLLFIIVIILLDRFLLKKSVLNFNISSKLILTDLVLSAILLITIYIIDTLSAMTYYQWIPNNAADKTELIAIIKIIFQNPFYTILFLGPVIWSGQIFLELSRVFLLTNLWMLSENKIWQWFIIILTAGIISLLSLDNGTTGIIFTFFVSLLFNTTYYKFRRILPLIITSIVYQLIPLINFAMK